MTRRKLAVAAVLGLSVSGLCTGAAYAQYELVIPTFDYRTGPFAPSGIPFANGQADYYTMLNERDGGICLKPGQCAKIKLVPCETAYNTQQGVECYEKTKGVEPSGALFIQPLSTGITYQIIPKAAVDKIPIFSMGYGRTSAADGRVFEWVFNFPATYWSQASALVNYIAEREGGHDKLKGKKITLIYHNSAYGKEPIPTLQALSQKHGFEYKDIAVDSPGQEQKAVWLQIRNEKPDWVLLWGWGVMNQVAVKEATSIRFPMDHFIGVWWSGAEPDVRPAGEAAKGYLAGTFHATGADFQAHKDIIKHVYDKGKAVDSSFKDRVGEVLHNRGIVAAMWASEAIRHAMQKKNSVEVKGPDVREGFENLDVGEARLKELGLEGFTIPVKVTCGNHEGPGQVALQQWDGKAWKIVTKYYTPDRELIAGLIKADSEKYAQESGIKPRDCK